MQNSYDLQPSRSDAGMRPRSAADSNRFASQSLGKFFQAQSAAMDEKTVNIVWKAFGSYIAKQLRNGKGVSVPRFGNFTFSAVDVDLAGTTNPGERDQQVRIPAFIVGKDFVSAVQLRAGVAHNNGAQIRPYDLKGSNGIIPKVKINYIEVASLAGQSKDLCKSACEQVFRFLSDKVRKGENCQMDIPFVGQFIVRNQIAAIAFKNEMHEETKGITAKGHLVNKLFGNSVARHNLKLHDGTAVATFKEPVLGGAMRLTGDAENWLKSNLNISVQELASQHPDSRISNRLQSAKQMHRYSSIKPDDLKQKAWAIQDSQNKMGNLMGGSRYQQNMMQQSYPELTRDMKQEFDRISQQDKNYKPLPKRPMSAATRLSAFSSVSQVPDIGRMKVMLIANDIYKNRSSIAEVLQSDKQSLRNILSSSQIQQVLKKVNIFIEIGNLKGMLKALNFKWNGPACSFFDLFISCKNLIYGTTQYEDDKGQAFSEMGSPKNLLASADKSGMRPFSTQRAGPADSAPLFTLKVGDSIDINQFASLIQKYSGNANRISDAEINAAFAVAAQGKETMPYENFEDVFKQLLHGGGDFETRGIRNIKEWMFKGSMSSETAFERLLTTSSKILEKQLKRSDFHKSFPQVGLSWSAPEIDAFFTMLDYNHSGSVDMAKWKGRIYEDSANPLQMLREVVQANDLTADDILFKMKHRIWDLPMDINQLTVALRRLDPTLSEVQLRKFYKVMKNKDGKVEVTALLRNLCGQEHETVDYRNKIFRQIYLDIHPNREDQLIQLLEDADPLNDGRVEPQGLKIALSKVCRSVDDESLDRFIRFLEKDKSGKVNYMEFMSRMADVSNRDHNPFKSVVQRLSFFVTQNKQTIMTLLKRLALKRAPGIDYPSSEAIPIELFSSFLKTKIDKKREFEQLRQFAICMDIDKDGFITDCDLQTCFNNLNSDAFFRNNGEALQRAAFSSQYKFYPTTAKMTEERVCELVKQIRTSLINQKVAYREAFNRFDANQDGFLSFGEFSQGLDKVLTMSAPIKEKLFAFMDKNNMGLVDYPNFLQVIQMSSASGTVKKPMEDNFDWEQMIIEKLQQWILTSRITAEEAFKCLDVDFDGMVSKEDLRQSLISIFQIKGDEILPTKLDRLYRLLDFYKTKTIQVSDIQRLIANENPYSAAGSSRTASTQAFRRSFGGNLTSTSTFDWKLSAIQQIGLYLSKKYSSLQSSFETASEHLQKMTFEQFQRFVNAERVLDGFNLTVNLIQKLFSELDPHKKGYLMEQDWKNAFQSFNWNDQLLLELKNSIQCHFTDCDSAFTFFLTFGDLKKAIDKNTFGKAVANITSERFKQKEIDCIWAQLTESGKQQELDKYHFRQFFDVLRYTGKSSVRNLQSAPEKTTIYTQNSSSSTWHVDVFEKLRQIIKSSSKSFEDVFKSMDKDESGFLSQVEFRNAIRKLNLGLKSREIDQLMAKIDVNNDGQISWAEFINKFKTKELDQRILERANDKMARVKELMILHMTSPNDAFRFFDESKLGKLSYLEFSKLIMKLYQLAGEKAPTYPVIKDIFDQIDIRKDGILDHNEWSQTFGSVTEGDQRLTIKATPLNAWEQTREFADVGGLISRNRKLLKDQFERFKRPEITFEEAKPALMKLFMNRYVMNDEKLKLLLRVAEIVNGSNITYDYNSFLGIYKQRHA